MIHGHQRTCPSLTRDGGELASALDLLDVEDQRVFKSLTRRLAEIERAHGEAVALAVAQRMERVLRGQEAA